MMKSRVVDPLGFLIGFYKNVKSAIVTETVNGTWVEVSYNGGEGARSAMRVPEGSKVHSVEY